MYEEEHAYSHYFSQELFLLKSNFYMNKCGTGRIDLLNVVFMSLINIFNASIYIIPVTGISRLFYIF